MEESDFYAVVKKKEEAFEKRAMELDMTVDELRSIQESFEHELWIKDVNPDGSFYIFRYGLDVHDNISVFGGIAHYRNLQNGDGCILQVIPETLEEEGYHLLDFEHLTDDDILYIKKEYL